MISAGDLDYAQARLQARHALTLTAAGWARLDGSRDLQHFLSTAAASTLARWTRSLDPGSGSHDLERALRLTWRDYVATIATWLPAGWQRATRWAGVLTELQYVARLADPGTCPAWMFADPLYGPLAPGTPLERATALRVSVLAPLAAAVAGLEDIDRAWHTHWRALLPAMSGHTRALVTRLESIVRSRATAAATATDTLQPVLDTLRRKLARLFRDAAGTPVSALAHLALQALELEDLRGRVVTFAAFASSGRVQ